MTSEQRRTEPQARQRNVVEFIDTHEGITLVGEGDHVRGATDAEKALRAERDRYRKALEQIADSVFVLDARTIAKEALDAPT